MKPLISVIIPTFNNDNYIKETINSVLNQTYTELEIIIIDDGSTDLTREIVNSFDDKRIKYLFIENSGGPARPRNVGIQKATGKYIAFLDSDDIWLSDKIERQLAIFESDNSCDVIFGDAKTFGEGVTEQEIIRSRYKYKNNCESFLYLGNFIPILTSICKKKSIENIQFNEEKYAVAIEDYLFWLDCAESGLRFKYLNHDFARYRIHPNQISKNQKKEIQKLILIYLKYLKKHKSIKYLISILKQYLRLIKIILLKPKN